MSYQVLALKWRPQVFDDVVGQETVTRTLKNAIQQGRIAHAFLFSGVRGVGKTTTARILAKALNCGKEEKPTVAPCGQCPSCREITSSSSLDVLEIDGASHTKVEEFRELLETCRYAPSRDRFKIYIIDEVHMLSTHSFNALLKTLEEPPSHLKFIFATTEYHKIPDTIASRCQQYAFRTVSASEIAAHLQRVAGAEGIAVSDGARTQIARAAEGSIRDALSALDQVVAATGPRVEEKDVSELLGLVDSAVLHEAARAVVERDTAAILRVVDELVTGGRDLQSFARGLMAYFRDLLVVRVAPGSRNLLEMESERDRLGQLASGLSEEDLVRSLDVLTQVESALRWSPEPRFHLEVALLKLAELRRLASFEEIVARLETLREGSPPLEPRAASAITVERGESVAGKPSGPPAAKAISAGARATPSATAPERRDVEPKEPVAGGPGAEELLARILERLRSKKPKLAALVSQHNGVSLSLEGDCLRIGFVAEQGFIREQVEQEEARRVFESTAAETAGRPIRLEIVVLGQEEPPEPTAPEKAPPSGNDRLYQRAMSDPMVRGFVETFQGEVEEVRPLGETGGVDDDPEGRTERQE